MTATHDYYVSVLGVSKHGTHGLYQWLSVTWEGPISSEALLQILVSIFKIPVFEHLCGVFFCPDITEVLIQARPFIWPQISKWLVLFVYFFLQKLLVWLKTIKGFFKKKFWLHTIKQSRESPSGLIFKQNLMKKKEAFYWKSFWNIPEDNMWYVNNGLIYMSCLFILSITADQLVCLITHPAWSYPKPSRDFHCQANLGFSPAQYFSPVSLSLSFVWHGDMGVTNIYAVPAPCNSTTTAILLGS